MIGLNQPWPNELLSPSTIDTDVIAVAVHAMSVFSKSFIVAEQQPIVAYGGAVGNTSPH